MSEEWKFVSEYSINEYKCGLKAGDKIRLTKDIVVTDYKDKPTGKIYSKGEIWKVLPGKKEEEIVVWLLQENGERHTWDDDDSIYENFEVIK